MVLEIVDPNSTEIEHLASVDVQFSGTHIGGGIYLATNHNPSSTGNVKLAVPQSSLSGEAEAHNATEIDYVVASGADPNTYRDDTNGDGTLDATFTAFDTSLFYGDRLTSTGEFYDGPAISMLIANDPNDLYGTVVVAGYPSASNSLDGTNGTLHQSTGTLYADTYTEQTIGSDVGGYFTVFEAEAVGGMSGGGTFLDYDADGDGATETYLIGTLSRAGTIELTDGTIIPAVQSTSLSPQYADLAAAIESLTGTDARTADDFARMTLLSGQTAGSTLTTVQGQFFHEDIYGGVNDDSLFGAGGNDQIFGGVGADLIDGGTGDDILSGGIGNDTLTGGAGADWFAGDSFGNGDTDIITDFEATGGDVIDLSSFFATLDDVVAASTELGDGSLLITLPAPSGGTIQVANTTINDLTEINVNIVCFTKGTLILTSTGEKPVESLKPGELVATYNGSFKPLRAINIRLIGKHELYNRPNLWPIQIEAGALGHDIPQSELNISPQHRILVNSKIAHRVAGQEVLLSAKELLSVPGICQPEPKEECTYIHLVFDTHEIIQANGCWSESFYPGDQAMQALPHSTAHEYRIIFGDTVALNRPVIKGIQARHILNRHLKNKTPIQSSVSSQAHII